MRHAIQRFANVLTANRPSRVRIRPTRLRAIESLEGRNLMAAVVGGDAAMADARPLATAEYSRIDAPSLEQTTLVQDRQLKADLKEEDTVSRSRETRPELPGIQVPDILDADGVSGPTKVFLDFGLGFPEAPGPNGESGHYFDTTDPEWVDGIVNMAWGENPFNGETVYMPDPRPFWGGYEWLNSLEDSLNEFGFDYDSDGEIDMADAESLAGDVLDLVKRAYEPFDVEVEIANASSWDDILETLASSDAHDAYVMVGGNRFGSGVLGLGHLDSGNEYDDIVTAYTHDIFGLVDETGDLHHLATALAKSAAHEAAHSFGLHHIESGQTVANDLMAVEQGLTKLTNETFATRGREMLTEDGDWQDSYQVLADTLGLKEDGPAYVTGTSLRDVIKLTQTIWGDVHVEVDSYSDSGQLLHEVEYRVDATNGVLIEAGLGNDRITVDGSFDVIARGGRGNDTISTGSGNDVLEGETGRDYLFAGYGDDTYVFGRGELNLGLDLIGDYGGNDTFDFSKFRGPIDVDLSQGGHQVLGSFDSSQPQLRIHLYNAGSIENVYGTDFDDTITGTSGDNKIVGKGGSDTIDGNGGSDEIFYGEELYWLQRPVITGRD